jgi:hypothetical protein
MFLNQEFFLVYHLILKYLACMLLDRMLRQVNEFQENEKENKFHEF